MTRFLIKIVVFALPLVLLAYVADMIVTKGLRKTRDDHYAVWNDIFNGKVNADVIVNGSSRAMVQVSPAILDSALGIRSYNLGCSGYGFGMQFCRFNALMKRNPKPKVVLHEVDYGTFTSRTNLFESTQFVPYLDDSIIYATTTKYDGLNFIDYHLPLLRYYANYGLVLVGVQEYFGIRHFAGRRYKGYVAHELPWNDDLTVALKKYPNGVRYPQQPVLIELFKSYLEGCRKENISVVLVWAPEYIEGQKFVVNRDSVRTMFRNIARDHELTFLDYGDDSISFNRDLFYNSRHLNKIGAEVFTRKLARDLRSNNVLENSPLFSDAVSLSHQTKSECAE